MYKFLINFFLVIGFVGFALSGNVYRGKDQTDKKGYRHGVIVVKYKSTAVISPSVKVSKNGISIAQVGISSLDQLHQQMSIHSVSKEDMYQPKDVNLVKSLGIDHIYLLRLDESADVETLAKQYATDPNVEAATPDWEVYPAAIPNDTYYTSHWGHNNTAQMPSYNWSTNLHNGPLVGTVGFDANAQAAWDHTQGYGSSSVVIAIIDGGVEWTHPDLSANIWTNPGESGGGKETNGVDDDGNGYIDDYHGWDFGVGDNNPNDDATGAGHGTCCAGVAAAVGNNSLGVVGIAAGCKIMPLKAANAAGSMYFTSINSAIYYAADKGAKVISMSLGSSSQDAANQTACTYAWNLGTIVLAATGNENTSFISYPAANTNVLGIGAASNCGDRKRSSSSSSDLNPGVSADPNGYTCDGERWWGSNYGVATKDAANAVDVIAPTILPTTDRVGSNGYETGDYELYFNGTSCATPYAAGVCALIFSKFPSLTPQQVRDTLCQKAQDIVNVESVVGWDRYTGYGMVDASAVTAGFVVRSLTLSSPNGGESWLANTLHNIAWIYTGSIANVKLEYTTDGSNFTVITASTTNSGTYAWTVPNNPSSTVKVKISDVDSSIYNDISNANFTINPPDVTPPVISNVQVTSILTTSAVVTWTTDEASSSTVNYGLTQSYGSSATGTGGVTSHSVSLTGLSSNTTYHYQVQSTDASSNTATDIDRTFQTISGQTLLGLDGGLEGTATVDNVTIATAGASGKWQKANSNQTISLENATVRSGAHSLRILNTSTTGRRVYSPLFGSVSDGSRLVLQYYRRIPSGTGQQNQHGIAFPTESLSGTYNAPASADTWEKQTYVPTSTTATGNKWAVIMHRLTSGGTNTLPEYIDDLAVYVGTAVDNTAPDPATSPIAAKTSSPSELYVSWTAPITGIDDGGYLVIRRIGLAPTGTPNVNGIYAVGNTIGDGTVVYQGTSNNFTDTGLNFVNTYYYKIYTYDKAFNYSSGVVTSGDSPLPIQLASFVGSYVDNGAKLEWQTISEANNYGFNVQRLNETSKDFETVVFVAGKGTTLEPQSYEYIDNQPGTSYRLEQIDNNGLKSYFGPIMLNPSSVADNVPAVFKLSQNYPNPFNPTTNISFSLANAGHTTLKIYNLIGKEVATLFTGNAEAGKQYVVNFDAKNLTSGIYFYKLQSGNSVEVKKLTLVK
jgi:hypothetical protein